VRQSSPAEPPPDPATRVEHALAIAYRYIDRREHSVEEVRRHLEAKGVQPQTTDEVLRMLGDQGQLDDARFARLFAEDKRALEGWGSERIRRGLIGRGIEWAVAEAALTGEDAESELDRAVALLRRRYGAPPDDRRERERALGLLLRKGYEGELALDALAAFARGE
jgi:regulatory protein